MWSGASGEVEGSESFARSDELSGQERLADLRDSVQTAARLTRPSSLGEMTSGIAHDFRNILAVIQSSLNLLDRAGSDRARADSCLSVARQGIERGLRLTSRLIDLASQEQRSPVAVSLNDLLHDLETFLKHGVGPEVTIVVDLAPDLPNCRVDRSRFSSAILNLVVNARDAMPGGGIVEISTEMAEPGFGDPIDGGSFVRVRVKDNGSGMPPDIVREIFNRYFTTKGESGSGLGVPQVCAFAAAIGGDVRVSSRLGEGTVFDLFIPAEGKTRLWRQVDRWENEGGAARRSNDGFRSPVLPEPGRSL